MKIFKKNKIEPQIIHINDNELLSKLREDKEELKKLKPKYSSLRKKLNDFCLDKGYYEIPPNMELFMQFFSCVDRDCQNRCSSVYYQSRDIDFIIEVLQDYRNEIFENEEIANREEELKKEIEELEIKLGI